MEQGTPGKKSASEANVDVGVLQREVEMLRESRQRDLAAAKENFSRELLARETDVQVLKDEYQKLLKAKNEQEEMEKLERYVGRIVRRERGVVKWIEREEV